LRDDMGPPGEIPGGFCFRVYASCVLVASHQGIGWNSANPPLSVSPYGRH
jgi:hypothetical protein